MKKGNYSHADKYPLHEGFRGFKIYHAPQVCCEICSRLAPDCERWSSPPLLLEDPNFTNTGCEFFFRNGTSFKRIPRPHLIPPNPNIPLWNATKENRLRGRRRLEVAAWHGRPHGYPTARFLGCGWSDWFTLEFPCLSGELDDKVYMLNNTFHFQRTVPATTKDPQSLPLCTLEAERIDFDPYNATGRWVREPWPDNQTCPEPMTIDTAHVKFDIMRFDADRPHCWHRDDLSRIGHKCIEINCRFINPESKWFSSVRKEKEWMGVWRDYDCSYVEFTQNQLQECITKRKISAINRKGRSIAEFIHEYTLQRLQNVTMHNATDPEAITVTVDTMELLHNLCTPLEDYEAKLKDLPQVGPNEEHYWVSGFYLSSEREARGHVGRIPMNNEVAHAAAKRAGYKSISAFELSSTFSFDTATQSDGMHIIGPPLKAVSTKLFHHMCSGVVEGSRM
jgi:hypothetical protein